jgi:hypothetical protein
MCITEEKENVLKEKLLVERHKTDFVGVIDIQKTLHLYLQQPKMYTDIFIPKDKIERQRRFVQYRSGKR